MRWSPGLDGGGFNPGYRVAAAPTSYLGITADYRRTPHTWEMLKPDIFLAAHAEWFGFDEKHRRAVTEGVKAGVTPEEYRRFVARYKRQFEDEVEEELGVAKGSKQRAARGRPEGRVRNVPALPFTMIAFSASSCVKESSSGRRGTRSTLRELPEYRHSADVT